MNKKANETAVEASETVNESRAFALWLELREDVESLKDDFQRSSLKQNVAAGVRIRKTLRKIRAQIATLIKENLTNDKAIVEQRKVLNAAKKAPAGSGE